MRKRCVTDSIASTQLSATPRPQSDPPTAPPPANRDLAPPQTLPHTLPGAWQGMSENGSVVLHSMKGRVDLNGRTVVMVGRAGKRYRLACEDGEVVCVKEENMWTAQEYECQVPKAQRATCATLEATVAYLVESCVQKVADDEDMAGREEEHRRQEALEVEEYGMPQELGFTGLSARGNYEAWLEVVRTHRQDPRYYDDVPDRTCPWGGMVDYSNEPTEPEPEDPYGMHPYFDYGYVARLGKGRVMWDLLRPKLRRAAQLEWWRSCDWHCCEEAAKSIERARIARSKRGVIDAWEKDGYRWRPVRTQQGEVSHRSGRTRRSSDQSRTSHGSV